MVLDYSGFNYIISKPIYPPDVQKSAIGVACRETVKQLPRFASGDAKISLLSWKFFIMRFNKDMTKIQNCSPRPPSRGKYRKVFFSKNPKNR